MFIKDEKIEKMEKSINKIIEDLSLVYAKVSVLYDIWQPSQERPEETESVKTIEESEQLEFEQPLISIKEFAKKYNIENPTKASSYCFTLRRDGVLTDETAPVKTQYGNIKRVYLTPEGEKILLDRLNSVKVRQKKRISEMSREELIRKLYQQNKKLRDSKK